MKTSVMSFGAALLAFSAVFLVLDLALMKMQGLTLIFHP